MKILVTGGAGFVGSNLVEHFLKLGNEIIVFDNLSRDGVKKNLNWIKKNYNKNLTFISDGVKNYDSLINICKEIDVIFHTAAQVAVTNSLKNPRDDFEVNALGTFNVLEAARQSNLDAIVIFCSTNKVYGNNVNKLPLKETNTRYEFSDENFKDGIPENFSTDANEHTPYGVSKYVAELYVRDYFAVYGLKTITFRMSCTYGEHQQGCSDQGWLDYIIRKAVKKEPITIYGDGKQVRDILQIKDLINAFELSMKNINKTKGQVYNMGGGPKNTISILELIELLKNQFKLSINYSFEDWRPFDQKVYISDIKKSKKDFDWSPQISREEGIKKQYNWIISNNE